MFVRKMIGAVLVLLLMLSGCAKTSDGQRTQVEAGALGGILGAVIGGVTGSSVAGATVGGAVGTATGFLVGTWIASEKEDHAAAEDTYDDRIAQISEFNSQLSLTNEELRRRNESRANEIARLEDGYRTGAVQKSQLEQEHNRTQEELLAIGEALEGARTELSAQEEALTDIRNSATVASATVEELENNTQTMRAYITELEGQIGVLAAQDASLARYL